MQQERLEDLFLQRFPRLENVYKSFGPDSWRYALDHIGKAVNTQVPALNRLDAIYHSTGADTALFVKHLISYYLLVERSGKPLEEITCKNAASIFLGRYGDKCTPVQLLCYFANYTEFKSSYREFDVEDIIIQYNARFLKWWGEKVAMYAPVTIETKHVDCGITGQDALKVCVRNWIEKGEDPKSHFLYTHRKLIGSGVTDELIAEVKKEMLAGVF